MPDYSDLNALVRGPIPSRPLPCFFDFAPCHAGMVGGIPNLTRYYFDVEEKLEIQMRVKDLLPEALILPGIFADFGVVVEVSAFGGRIHWFENGAPFIGPVLESLEEIDHLKPPQPGTTGLTAPLLIQQEMLQRKLRGKGKELDPWAFSMGPAEIAGLLLGYDRYYCGLYDDPKRIQALMEMITDFILGWIRTQERQIGEIQALMIADHVVSQVNPNHLETFILPYLQAIFQAFPKPIKIYHNEGLHSPRHIQAILKSGVEVWHFGSDVHSLEDLYSQIGDRIVPWGGLNPHGAIRTGSPDEVRKETRKAKQAAKGKRLLLSTGTGTTPDASLENVRAMVEEALTDSANI
jgi:uroporphyrinogen-III decarboxylase